MLLCVEIALNLGALNIHFDKMNSFLCVHHFLGMGCFLFYLFDRWHYRIIMYIFFVFV